jgi:8-oxo-dGTP pyrophosphatase MutT (NUDIX family)
VALVLDDALELLLIRRAEREGDPWSGDLGLPGGGVESEDRDQEHTAMRETWEEVGLDLSTAVSLGALDDVASPAMGRRSVVVRPYVFWMSSLPALRPNEEVAAVHRIGLPRLLRGEGRSRFLYEWGDHQVPLPEVDVDGRRLWGMTLRVIDDLLDRLDGRGAGLARPQR